VLEAGRKWVKGTKIHFDLAKDDQTGDLSLDIMMIKIGTTGRNRGGMFSTKTIHEKIMIAQNPGRI
jgi:hypothetical protein